MYNFIKPQDGANVYDAINRGYDPAIGRFWQMDAMADEHPDFSSFAFVYNNPIGFSDPMGLDTAHKDEYNGAHNPLDDIILYSSASWGWQYWYDMLSGAPHTSNADAMIDRYTALVRKLNEKQESKKDRFFEATVLYEVDPEKFNVTNPIVGRVTHSISNTTTKGDNGIITYDVGFSKKGDLNSVSIEQWNMSAIYDIKNRGVSIGFNIGKYVLIPGISKEKGFTFSFGIKNGDNTTFDNYSYDPSKSKLSPYIISTFNFAVKWGTKLVY